MNVERILVIANETAASPVLHEAIAARAGGAQAEVLVVAPALNSRLRHWVSDEDEARRAAQARLARCLASLSAAGIEAAGRIGDPDPLQAIGDALHVFPAEEVVIVTHPEGRSNWLAHDLVGRARARLPQPVTHIVAESPQPRGARPGKRRLAPALLASAIAALALAPLSSAGNARAQATAAIRVQATEFSFVLSAKSARHGTVVFVVTNTGHALHNFVIHGKATPILQPGATARLVVTFAKAGKYAYLCSVDGHAAMGMKGVFAVR